MEYTKDFELLTENVREVLSSGFYPTNDEEKWSKFLGDTCGGDRVLGLIEFPTIDIELEAYTKYGGEPCEATDCDNGISLSYFVCTKGLMPWGREEWMSDDFVSGGCKVDFSDPNWESLLERDMLEKLDEYVKANGYSYTELNF